MNTINHDSTTPRGLPDVTGGRGTLDLASYAADGFSLFEYKLTSLLDNIVLVQYLDENDHGEISRGGIFVPLNTVNKVWRIGKIILAGPYCKFVKQGDIVTFPNDKGISTSNITVDGQGDIKNAVFLNEDRLFGVCKCK